MMNYKSVFWGVILIVIGSLFLIQELTDFDFNRFLVPVVLIVAGGMLLLRNYVKPNGSGQ